MKGTERCLASLLYGEMKRKREEAERQLGKEIKQEQTWILGRKISSGVADGFKEQKL